MFNKQIIKTREFLIKYVKIVLQLSNDFIEKLNFDK